MQVRGTPPRYLPTPSARACPANCLFARLGAEQDPSGFSRVRHNIMMVRRKEERLSNAERVLELVRTLSMQKRPFDAVGWIATATDLLNPAVTS